MRSQTAALDAATLGEETKTEATPADILDDRPMGGSESDAGWLDPLP